jgi:hypothetical protein
MARLTNLLLVTGCIGSPYAHIPLWEKVFYKIENDGILFLGRRNPQDAGRLRLHSLPRIHATPHSAFDDDTF